jgi:hypothetical protein
MDNLISIDRALKLAERLSKIVTSSSPEYVKAVITLANELSKEREEIDKLNKRISWLLSPESMGK